MYYLNSMMTLALSHHVRLCMGPGEDCSHRLIANLQAVPVVYLLQTSGVLSAAAGAINGFAGGSSSIPSSTVC